MNTIFQHMVESLSFSLAEGGDGEIFAILDGKGVRIPLQQEETILTALCTRAIERQQRSLEEPISCAQAQDTDSQLQSNGYRRGLATNPEMAMREAIVSILGPWAESLGNGLTALTKATCAAYGRHEAGEAYGLPPYEPPTCGTDHLFAERALRILGCATPLNECPGEPTVRAISHLVERAGLAFARESLVRDALGTQFDDSIPF